MSLFDKLRSKLPDGASEDDSDYDGVFSYAAEHHAFSIGFYEGLKDFKDWNGLPDEMLDNPDVEKEPHYARGGYVIGSLVRVALYLTVGAGAVQFA